MAEIPHGSASSYNNRGCRCDACRAAASAARAQWVASLGDRLFDEVPHGTPTGYRNWGCRCDACKACRSAEARAVTARRRERGRQDWPG